MIILDTTTRKLQVLLGGAVATNQCPCMASWVDVTSSAYTPGTTVANTNSTTAVDLVAAPASSTYRQIKTLSIYNADTASVTVTVRYNDNGTTYTLLKVTLPTLYHLVYTDTDGWSVHDTAGGRTAVQSLALTGHVTGSGIGSIATTIANGVVTEAMQSLSDNTTGDVSTSRHGYVPKAPNDTTKFLRGDGTWVAPSGGGGMINRTVLTSGTSFTTQSTTTKLVLRMQGGGGGGNGTANAGGTFTNCGGGGGGYIEKRVTVSGSTAYTYAIGAAGSAGSSGSGGNGGDTTFTVGATTYTAAGGGGGSLSTPGTGGSGTNGDITIPGQPGCAGFLSNTDLYAVGGHGGGSQLGQGGWAKGGNVPGGQAGTAGTNYGGGGSSNSYAGNGGAGAAGCIIVEEY